VSPEQPSMQSSSSDSYAQLDDNPIRFQPVSEQTNVFYDAVQSHLFTVEKADSNSLLVRVQTCQSSSLLDSTKAFSFRLKDCGEVKSMKFSADCRILAVQRSSTAVEFVNFATAGGAADTVEYSQTCKTKAAQILGFQWTQAANHEVLYVTDCGLELFSVTPEKRSLRLVKSAAQQCNWYAWHHAAGTAALSSGPLSNQFSMFKIGQSSLVKTPRFEVDLPHAPSSSLASSNAAGGGSVGIGGRQPLRERDVFLAELYGQLYLGVLKHYVKPGGGSATEIALYQQPSSDSAGNPRKSDLLVLQQGGRLAVSIVDNLVLVHHQRLQRSFAFDIALPAETDGYLRYHQPVTVEAMPLAWSQPQRQQQKQLPRAGSQQQQQPQDAAATQLYSQSWIFFLPDVIVDAQAGLLWRIRIRPDRLSALMFPMDPGRCLHCLHLRANAKIDTANALRRLMLLLTSAEPPAAADAIAAASVTTCLPVLAYALDLLAAQESPQPGPLPSPPPPPPPSPFDFAANESPSAYSSLSGMASFSQQQQQLLSLPARAPDPLTQSDLYVHLLAEGPATEAEYKAQVFVILEFVRALNDRNVPVQHFLFETLVRALVTTGRFGELHQLIQYHVISDSKPIACLLLSLQSLYPPAHQLALDMMKRLGSANEEILEVLLSQGRVLSAVKFLRSVGKFDSVAAHKLLEVAFESGDWRQFYSVFRALEQRNARLRGSAAFQPADHCQRYVAEFAGRFGQTALGQLRAL
ncbi:hypothetical protein BOX15_Mlig007639g2, partial [Macrostomum lignano]